MEIDSERPPLVILISRRRREKILEMGKVATLENRAEGANFFETLKDPPLVISVKIKLGGGGSFRVYFH